LLHWQKLIQRTLRNAPPEVVAGNA
jgi:hypothetical protein